MITPSLGVCKKFSLFDTLGTGTLSLKRKVSVPRVPKMTTSAICHTCAGLYFQTTKTFYGPTVPVRQIVVKTVLYGQICEFNIQATNDLPCVRKISYLVLFSF